MIMKNEQDWTETFSEVGDGLREVGEDFGFVTSDKLYIISGMCFINLCSPFLGYHKQTEAVETNAGMQLVYV